MNFEIGDRVIVTHLVDEDDEEFFQAGDYGRIVEFSSGYLAGVKFKRCSDMGGNPSLGHAAYWVEIEALMKCKKRMTWEQIRVLADIIAEGK